MSTSAAETPFRLPGWQIVLLGTGMGVLAGWLEALTLLLRHLLLHRFMPLGAYLLWMPAAANALFFLAVSLLAVLAHRMGPRLFTPTRLFGLFVTLTGMAALRPFDNQLGVITVNLIALGVAVRVSSRLSPRMPAVVRRWALAGPVLLLLVGFSGIGLEARYALIGRQIRASLPAAGAGPNVLLLVLDTVRSMNLSVYGYPRPTTPTLERLAGEGVVFEHAISTAPWTLPSHAGMFTGRWAHELSASWADPLDDRFPTLAEALDHAGYRTGGFSANLSYAARSMGLARGFAAYDGHRVSLAQIARTASFTTWVYNLPFLRPHLPYAWRDFARKTAGDVNQAFLGWLDHSGDRPFFAFLNYFDAHETYLPIAPYDTAFSAPAYPEPEPSRHGGVHKDDQPRSEREYDQAIAYIDHEIGALLGELDRRGKLANTLVIVTSDHGEEFGEHGIYGHGHTLYIPGLSVPLLMVLPGQVPARVRVANRVSLRDLPATVMALAAPGQAHDFPGTSLARFWLDSSQADDTLLVQTRYATNRPEWDATSRGDLQGVLVGQQHFIRDVDLHPELYALDRDPWERQDLAGTDSVRVGHFAATLDRVMGPPARKPE